MPIKVPPERQYLELHGGSWRVTITVPEAARAELGGRLRKDLRTDSLKEANLRKGVYVREFQARIKAVLAKAGVHRKRVMDEAERLAEWARLAKEQNTPKHEWDAYYEAVAELKLKLAEEGGQYVSDPDAPWDPDFGPMDRWEPDPESVAMAEEFADRALLKGTAFEERHAKYLTESKVQARTLADDRRALALLVQWLASREPPVPPFVERVTPKRAREFAKALPGLAGVSPVTANKYISRLSSFWIWLAGEVDSAAVNPWANAAHKGARPKAGEEERAFTDTELAKLLTGPATPHMLDLMYIGALTGARLDAIVDLTVGDCENDVIMFHPRKKETHQRYVPIHPDLAPIIARRSEGKTSDSWMFPEWPPVKKAGSMRERSFKASNHFTDYRRLVGVDEVVPGARRARTNFHSFRRWFISRMEQAGVDGDLISAIVGHQRGSITLDTYAEGASLELARKAIAKIKLPPLDGSPIREIQTVRARRRPS